MTGPAVSGDDGLLLVRVRVNRPSEPERWVVGAISRAELLALPEVAALRAKAAAVDRVRELLETWQRCAADEAGADLRIWAGALARTLNGPPTC